MDKIQKCALNFLNLVNTTSYVFHLANRRVYIVSLDFTEKDFYHLAGFQYLTDISIPKNRKTTLSWILNKNSPVTDAYLAQSRFYRGKTNDEKNIEKRIASLQFLEQYLDEYNIMRIYSPNAGPRNNSLIKCDYIIESRLPSSPRHSLHIPETSVRQYFPLCCHLIYSKEKCFLWRTGFILDAERQNQKRAPQDNIPASQLYTRTKNQK